MLPPRATLVSCLAAVAMLVLVPTAWANFAPRFWGDAATEPWGLKDIAIEQERLTIDLCPLADGNPVRVKVTYDLNNTGASKHVDLLFVCGEVGISDFEARFGDEPLRTRLLPSDEARRLWQGAPQSWRPPQQAPGLEREQTYYTFHDWAGSPELVAFSLELPPGPSTLRVRYRARACGTAERPTVTWQFPYVLAPAREWGSFGRLDVAVYLPNGWQARSTPALDREGDTLRGSFTELPADALLLAAGAPVPEEYYRAVLLTAALWVIVLVGGGVMCWWAGRRLARARAGAKASGREAHVVVSLCRAVLGILPALLWGLLIYALVPASPGIIKPALHGQENPSFGEPWFAGPCLNFFIIPAFVMLGAAIALRAASRAERLTVGSMKGAGSESQGCA
jgi:hypothetical protein